MSGQFDLFIKVEDCAASLQPATWSYCNDGLATIVCPICKSRMILRSHAIYLEGNVLPSVKCSASEGCDYHRYIRLENWIAQ